MCALTCRHAQVHIYTCTHVDMTAPHPNRPLGLVPHGTYGGSPQDPHSFFTPGQASPSTALGAQWLEDPLLRCGGTQALCIFWGVGRPFCGQEDRRGLPWMVTRPSLVHSMRSTPASCRWVSRARHPGGTRRHLNSQPTASPLTPGQRRETGDLPVGQEWDGRQNKGKHTGPCSGLLAPVSCPLPYPTLLSRSTLLYPCDPFDSLTPAPAPPEPVIPHK